jgi:hypothetical protein
LRRKIEFSNHSWKKTDKQKTIHLLIKSVTSALLLHNKMHVTCFYIQILWFSFFLMSRALLLKPFLFCFSCFFRQAAWYRDVFFVILLNKCFKIIFQSRKTFVYISGDVIVFCCSNEKKTWNMNSSGALILFCFKFLKGSSTVNKTFSWHEE